MSVDTDRHEVIEHGVERAVPSHDAIEARELPYLQEIAAGRQKAQEMLQQAQTLQQQAVALIGAHDSYLAYLLRKHGRSLTCRIDPQSGIISEPEAE